jgi:capsular exopolysaccharide synthesis family protein
MSKIYEALRQAELDRAQQAESQPAVPARPPAAQAVLDAQHAPIAPASIPSFAYPLPIPEIPVSHTPMQWEAAAVPVPAAKIDEAASAPVDPPALDLTGIRYCVWKPSLRQLPAVEPRGPGVEQFRSLRSRMYEFRDLNALKSILVSSGLPQEGKSFVTANLAISFARHKSNRVLLIDGDMRRPTQHKLLGCSQGPGLTEYLGGKCTLSEVMQRPKAEDPNNPLPIGLAALTFIPGGSQFDKAADLSGNHRFDRLIETVSPFFEWIVVDSSPVNLVSDGVNLAHACDAALLVARGGVTKFEIAQRALTELKATKILGFVLNAVVNPTIAAGYYGYDGYDQEPETKVIGKEE